MRHVARGALLEFRIEHVVPAGLKSTPLLRVPKLSAPLWHSRQSVKTTGRRSSLAFIEPCGLVADLAALHAHRRMLVDEGPALIDVAFDAGRFGIQRLLHHARASAPFSRSAAKEPCGLWQSEHCMKPSFTRCFEGIENCAWTVAVAAVAELVLLLGQQEFRRRRVVDRVATGAGHVVLGVLGALDVGLVEIVGVAGQAGLQRLFGLISEKARGMVVLPPPAAMWPAPARGSPSQPVLSGGSLPEATLL